MYRLAFNERHEYGEDGKLYITVQIALSANDMTVGSVDQRLVNGADNDSYFLGTTIQEIIRVYYSANRAMRPS